ncbi:unnamed protein product (macronuclear) [Paramecium tetraurelia]|uniref:Transmembrane protein n=1 Tax=Paramecium tetraurelia TaxID=5888 RepID=A0D7W7_PARTE|nr:uncharacterized protein GSPATT00014101001 [Paramecium tetraurelia]CAK79134.1 unnamed protein product [Paramecium tetraurelia]|eukprot:XP_001446531.1 hypothetical protein (macronuclear) [Paramecium tetraurelia strain d4-2]
MVSVLAGIAKLDIFGQMVFLRINKQAYYKTVLGGCASIGVMAIMMTIFITNFITFIQKEQLKVITISEYDDKVDQIAFNNSNFLFAVQIEQDNFIENPYFNITLKQKVYSRSQQGDLLKKTEPIELVPCTLDRFNQIFAENNVNFHQQFQQLQLQNFLCPSINSEIQIGGTQSSTLFQFIDLSVSECQNNSTNQWKPNCRESDQHTFKIKLLTVNQIINPYKPKESYVQPFIDDSFSFSFNINFTKSINAFITKFDFLNDESLLPISMFEERSFYVLDPTDVQQDYTEIIEDSFVKLLFRKKPFKTKFQRQYQKIDELLSNIGGILQIFSFFIGLLNQLYFLFLTLDMVELGNKLYDFSIDDSDQKKIYQDNLQILVETQANDNNAQDSQIYQKMQQAIIADNEIRITDSQTQPLKQDQKLSTKLCCSSGLDYFQNQLQKMFQKKKPINLDLKIFFNFITCGMLFSKIPKVQLMNKAYDQIIQQSDIYSLLTRLNEIDKLKEVLLTPKQLVMFNFTPKPLITLEEEDLKINRNMVENQLKTPKDNKEEMLVYARMMMKQKRQNKIGMNHESIRKKKRSSFIPQPLNNYVYQQIYNVTLETIIQAYEEIVKRQPGSSSETLNSQLISMLGAELELIYQVCQKIDQDVRPFAKYHQKLKSSLSQKRSLIKQDLEKQNDST